MQEANARQTLRHDSKMTFAAASPNMQKESRDEVLADQKLQESDTIGHRYEHLAQGERTALSRSNTQ